MCKLRTAVIGLGQIGNTYDLDPLRKETGTHVGGYLKNPYVELVGVSDISPEKIALFKKMRGDFPAYTEYGDLLDNGNIDLLSICTHADTHLEIIKKAIRKGVKAIFCEKPLCTNMVEAKAIKELVEKNNIFFAINISRRWDNALQGIKEFITNGNIGEIQGVYGSYVKGIYNTGTHLIDLLRMMFGEISGIRAIKNGLIREIDPTPDLVVCFKNFNAVILGLNVDCYLNFELKIFGTKGAVKIANSGYELKLLEVRDHDLYSGFNRLFPSQHSFGTGLNNLMQNAIDDTVDRIMQNKPPRCAISDGIMVMRNIESVIKQCNEER